VRVRCTWVVDLERYRTRLILAFACAIALHEIVLSVLRSPTQPTAEERQPAAQVIVIQTASPTPTPAPTPRPTPPPTPPPRLTIPPRATLAPRPQLAGQARGTPSPRRGGGAPRARILAAVPAPFAAPSAAGSGTGTSVGTGTGNAPGVGGGLGAKGTGTSGNGNGAVNAQTPCGVVEFETDPVEERHGTTVGEHVTAIVSFPDHHRESAPFPYPWVYQNAEETDPWSSTNLKKGSFDIALQMPPPGADVATYSPLIQYIIKHTQSNGTTDLPPCPGGK